AAAGGGVEAARVARVHRDGMDVLIEAVVERLERLAAVARAEDAALLDADVHRGRLMRIEGDGTHVRDMRRWRKRPSVAPRDFQEAVAFLEEVSAIVAAEQAGVRGPDEHAILHGGRCGDRPDLFLARERGSYVGPGSAGVGRARERALAADVLGRAGVDERGIGGILRHAPDG